MKHYLTLIILLLTCVGMRAQEAVSVASEASSVGDDIAAQRSDVFTVYYGGEWLWDSYLSPLLYDGWTAGLGNEWWTDFRHQSARQVRWRHVGSLLVSGGYTTQAQGMNTIGFFDIEAGWGAHPVWRLNTGQTKGIESRHIELYGGAYLGAGVMMQRLLQHDAKTYSFDIGADLSLKAGMGYAFRCKKTAYRLVYEAEMNVLGAMWLPDYWESYYEISEKVNLDGSVVCAHWGNRQHLKQLVALDFEFKHSSWRLGVRHEYLHYGDEKRYFARQQLSLAVGCIFDYKLTKSRF